MKCNENNQMPWHLGVDPFASYRWKYGHCSWCNLPLCMGHILNRCRFCVLQVNCQTVIYREILDIATALLFEGFHCAVYRLYFRGPGRWQKRWKEQFLI
jgi:hypothetical protein